MSPTRYQEALLGSRGCGRIRVDSHGKKALFHLLSYSAKLL